MLDTPDATHGPQKPSKAQRAVNRAAFCMLLGLGILGLGRGIYYFTTNDPAEGVKLISGGVFPLSFWASCWSLAGVLCIIGAFFHRKMYMGSLYIGMNAWWAVAFAGVWLFQGRTGNTWFTALGFIGNGLFFLSGLYATSVAQRKVISEGENQ